MPVFVSFAIAEWMLLTETGSFTCLLGFIGVIVVSLVAGIFPVLLLVASRRKGEHIPRPASRLLGNPVLLGTIYVLFLAGLLLHGLVIWESPLLRAGALFVFVATIVMTVVMYLTGSFARRLNINVRDDPGRSRTSFAVTSNGREARTQDTVSSSAVIT